MSHVTITSPRQSAAAQSVTRSVRPSSSAPRVRKPQWNDLPTGSVSNTFGDGRAFAPDEHYAPRMARKVGPAESTFYSARASRVARWQSTISQVVHSPGGAMTLLGLAAILIGLAPAVADGDGHTDSTAIVQQVQSPAKDGGN
ncbi:MAG TPA: hypothetical protein H9867_02125 [Candidatus Corynebacterium gallistercoris]|uniref:Cell wall hydrolase interfering with FtsZ ring assembly n=1 Tax=Candidatus Corynebacterium gallistercoris TaxID=2838530 RepID=A0A9D1RX77_9CORY|nr:hypothetical protein [Candidatus Corynebacterium gallistercoris]